MKVTALYAGILGVMYLFLSARIMLWRFFTGVVQGDGEGDSHRGVIRAHANFFEYVPLTLLLILLVDFSSADDRLIHGLGAGLVVARLLHAVGMYQTDGVSIGRRVGTALTVVVLAVAAALCIQHGLS